MIGGPRQSGAPESLRERPEVQVSSRDASLTPTPIGTTTLPTHSLVPSFLSNALEPRSLQRALQVSALITLGPEPRLADLATVTSCHRS